jgi:hypothetical protein
MRFAQNFIDPWTASKFSPVKPARHSCRPVASRPVAMPEHLEPIDRGRALAFRHGPERVPRPVGQRTKNFDAGSEAF